MSVTLKGLLLDTGLMAEPQLRRVLTELKALELTKEHLAGTIILWRCIALDFLQEPSRRANRQATSLRDGELMPGVRDWNRPMRIVNEWFDRQSAAAMLPDPAEARQAMADVDEIFHRDYNRVLAHYKGFSKVWRFLEGGHARASNAEEGIAYITLLGSLSAVSGAARMCERMVVRNDLLRLRVALELFRFKCGAYPEQLTDLSPSLIAKLPNDVFSGGPFKYRRDAAGYTLYSVGENGRDDGGVWNERKGKDDYDVHSPMPAIAGPTTRTDH